MISTLPARRGGLILALCVVATLCGPAAAQQAAPVSAGPPDPKLIEDLVAASRILADHGLSTAGAIYRSAMTRIRTAF
jgi:hypothetical protein